MHPSSGAKRTSSSSIGACCRRSANWPIPRHRWKRSSTPCAGFSCVSCLRGVGCSRLSPIAYCGRIDAEEVRDRIRHGLKAWLEATLARYPVWVRDAVVRNPEWVEARLARNPQWINEQVKRMSVQGDLFA